MLFGLLPDLAPRPLDAVRNDFETHLINSPVRCSLCRQMFPAGHEFCWVAQSAGFFTGRESYQSLLNGSKGAYRSGACIDCVRAYR